MSNKKNNGEDWEADSTYKWLEKREAESASEAKKLRERLFEEATKKKDNGTASDKAMQYIKETTDRAIESERRSAERLQDEQEKTRQEFERLTSRMQNSGIPPEMLQTLTEQHRSEMNALNESRIVQIQQTQDRYEHEIKSLRERYEREISNIQDKHADTLLQTRGDIQGRLDRTEEQYKRELDRAREESERRYDKLNEDWQRRLDQEKQNTRSDRESFERHTGMQSEHMKSLHDSQVRQLETTLNGQISQERSQHESALVQQKAQYEAQLKMQETSFQSRVDSLGNEVERMRADLSVAQTKVMEQGDLATQAKKIKDVNESLGAVFNLGGATVAGNALADVDIEPKQEEPKTWWGKLMQFADSPLGEGAFDFLKNMAAGATGMNPMMPGLPGAYGPPPGYGPPPQPSYAPPQPNYAPPQPAPQPPYSSVYEPDVVEPGVATGTFVEEEAEPAGPGPETPQIEDNVIRATVTPADPSGAFGGVTDPRGPEVSPEEVESLHNQDAQPQPSSQPQPQPQPQPTQEIPPEAVEQLKGLIEGLEGSMSTNVQPHVLAGTIIKMAPPEQVLGLVQTPIAQFIATIQQIAPESMLLTFHGRKYFTALQQALAQQIQPPPPV